MFQIHLPLSQRVAAGAIAACAGLATVGGNFVLSKSIAAAVLLAASPLASAQLASAASQARAASESVWGPFVYERLGATPSLRLGRSAATPAPTASAARTDIQTAAIRVDAVPANPAGTAAGSEASARPAANPDRTKE